MTETVNATTSSIEDFGPGYWARVNSGVAPGAGESAFVAPEEPDAPSREGAITPVQVCLNECPLGLNGLDYPCTGPVEGDRPKFFLSRFGGKVVRCGGLFEVNETGTVVPKRPQVA
jgi:hypothetical protein